jgi:hypothetical protein
VIVCDEEESGSHENSIHDEGVAQVARPGAPDAECDEHGSECQHLADFDADVEAQDVRGQERWKPPMLSKAL